MHPHQELGVRAILDGFAGHYEGVPINAFLLCDEMGLGKTIQAFQALKENMKNTKNPTLIVCPSSVIHVWNGDDYQAYFNSDFNDIRIVSDNDPVDDLDTKSIVICSYTTLTQAFKVYLEGFLDVIERERLETMRMKKTQEFKTTSSSKKRKVYQTLIGRQWGHLVLDEVHFVKTPTSMKAKAVGFLKAEYRLGLTGTPVMNHGGDMVSILRYGLAMFNVDWETIRNAPNSEYCRNLLSHFTLQRTRESIGLKKRDMTDEIIFLEWTNYSKGADAYRKVKAESIESIASIENLFRREGETQAEFSLRKRLLYYNFFAKMQRLRQLCLYLPKSEPSPKMLKLVEIYKSLGKEKLVVVSTYKTFLVNVLAPWLEKKQGISVEIFQGGSRKKQADALDAFKKCKFVKMLLVVKQAGAHGLNLQGAASTLVIMDPHFNSALDEQAAHRVDRIGQDKKVVIKKMFMAKSIDVAMLNMQREKEKQATAWTQKNNRERDFRAYSLHLTKFDTV